MKKFNVLLFASCIWAATTLIVWAYDSAYSGVDVDAAISNAITDAAVKVSYELNANTNAFTDANVTTVGNQSGTNTGDMSNADVKTAYEANAQTNAVTDAEKTVLGNTSGTNSGDMSDADVKTAYEFKSIQRRKTQALKDWQYEVIQDLNKVSEINPERAAFMLDSIKEELTATNKMLLPGFLNAYALARKNSKMGVETQTVINALTKQMIERSTLEVMGLEVGK